MTNSSQLHLATTHSLQATDLPMSEFAWMDRERDGERERERQIERERERERERGRERKKETILRIIETREPELLGGQNVGD